MENQKVEEGFIVVGEKRNNVDAVREEKIKILNNVNKEEKTAHTIDKIFEVTRNVVLAVGSVVTVIGLVCPLDGPVIELFSAGGTAAILAALKEIEGTAESIFLNNKDSKDLSAVFLNSQGETKDITITDTDMVKNVDSKDNSNLVNAINSNQKVM